MGQERNIDSTGRVTRQSPLSIWGNPHGCLTEILKLYIQLLIQTERNEHTFSISSQESLNERAKCVLTIKCANAPLCLMGRTNHDQWIFPRFSERTQGNSVGIGFLLGSEGEDEESPEVHNEPHMTQRHLILNIAQYSYQITVGGQTSPHTAYIVILFYAPEDTSHPVFTLEISSGPERLHPLDIKFH